ncbi:MAG TPA: hypothetical protein VKV74_18100 [Bryobacteraceae bacterium]|nr:hypothetical protein [Bryobacteraceae bacterium]
MTKISLVIAFGLTGCFLQAQWIQQPTVGIPRTPGGKADLTAPAPRSADGKPDFSGLWTFFPGKGGLTQQLKPSDIKPWAEALHKQRDEDLSHDSPASQCLPGGFGGFGLAKVLQTPGLIVILMEDLTYRQIFLDGRQLPKDPNPAWMGYSVGHWEGDTLVVESTGYNDRTWLEQGYPHTENLRLTERWSRADFGHMSMDVTFSDPAIYAKPWSSSISAAYTADTDLLEYVCAENEKDRVHSIGKKSDDTKHAVSLPPEVLSKYAGRYDLKAKELTGVDLLPLTVSLEDGALKLGVADAPGEMMIPLSEVTFTGFGGYIEFGKNGKGEVTNLVIRIAEGDFPAARRN